MRSVEELLKRYLKKRRHRPLREIGAELGISPATLCRFESGERGLSLRNYLLLSEWVKKQ
jgi:hypothetical protein